MYVTHDSLLTDKLNLSCLGKLRNQVFSVKKKKNPL